MPRKKPKHQKQSKATGTWIFLMICLIGEFFFYTWCRVEFVRTGYEISKMAQNHQSLLARQNNLTIELARLNSPHRVIQIAKEQLDLTMPRPEQLIVIQ